MCRSRLAAIHNGHYVSRILANWIEKSPSVSTQRVDGFSSPRDSPLLTSPLSEGKINNGLSCVACEGIHRAAFALLAGVRLDGRDQDVGLPHQALQLRNRGAVGNDASSGRVLQIVQAQAFETRVFRHASPSRADVRYRFSGLRRWIHEMIGILGDVLLIRRPRVRTPPRSALKLQGLRFGVGPLFLGRGHRGCPLRQEDRGLVRRACGPWHVLHVGWTTASRLI